MIKNKLISIGLLSKDIKNIKILNDIYNYIISKFKYFEIIIISNPSDDFIEIEKDISKLKNIRHIILNKHAPNNILIGKIFEVAIGDILLLINPNEVKHSVVDTLFTMIINDNIDYVILKYIEKNSIYSKFAKIIYLLISLISGLKLNSSISCSGCFSKQFINYINSTKNQIEGIRVILQSSTIFSGKTITAAVRRNRSLLYILHQMSELINVIGSAPYRILQITAWFSLAAFITCIVYILYILLVWIFATNIQPGWTTTSIILSILFGFTNFAIFCFTSIISSYICRNTNNIQYVIAYKSHTNKIFSNFDKLNITSKL